MKPFWTHHDVEDEDDIPVNPTHNPTFAQVEEARWTRRGFLKGLVATAATATTAACATADVKPDDSPAQAKDTTPAKDPSTLGFQEIRRGLDQTLHVPEGYQAQVVISWGDPVVAGAPDFDPDQQTPAAQGKQFGFNNDFVAYMPLPRGSNNSDHGLLVVNHEYTNAQMMFPGSPKPAALDQAQMEVDLLANGVSILEVKKVKGQWIQVKDSDYGRRITPRSPVRLEGPAAGHPRMKTRQFDSGDKGMGIFGLCAGGVTPWGTILTAEENVNKFFLGDPADSPEEKTLTRFGFYHNTDPPRGWGRFFPRFDLAKSPREPLHFGWLVEIDPYDPTFVPRKRTAMGHFKHEGAGMTVDKASGKIVAYMGDDQRFEYVYRFVSRDPWMPGGGAEARRHNMDLLNHGTLSVAQFKEDGTVHWRPLVHGQGPLTSDNGFDAQADVLIETRRAADLMGGTRMDRPEDIEVNPVTGSAFVMLTRNKKRKADQCDPANPRPENKGGHIVEISPIDEDHTAPTSRWEILLMGGKPDVGRYHEGISDEGWLVSPDNCAFDNQGRLWITTDGANHEGFADGVWVCDVTGTGRALTKHFLRAPIGAEVTGPYFTPDNRTFFCSIQHPGEGSSYDEPSTRWPEEDPGRPPRPSVIAVTRVDGEALGDA